MLSHGIYELWGSGCNYSLLRDDVRTRRKDRWSLHRNSSFRFKVDSFGRKRTAVEQRELIDFFSFLDLDGPIRLSDAEIELCVFEYFAPGSALPEQLHLGRLIAWGGRRAVATFDLKSRRYISTTSMDSEVSLITANMALSGPGKLMYDPFMGTGGLPIACAHFGAVVLGSDIDGRSIRGTKERNVRGNFLQYGLQDRQLDSFVSDLTNSPLRKVRFLDGIVCDPPYGVREGLKVLGKIGGSKEATILDGQPAHL